jgi:hypothetical protein
MSGVVSSPTFPTGQKQSGAWWKSQPALASYPGGKGRVRGMSEVQRLAEHDAATGLVARHVSWGPEASGLTDEERAAIINSVTADVEAQLADTVPIPVSQLVDIADALQALSQLGRAEVSDWLAMNKEIAAFRRKVGSLAEFPAMFAEQWLPADIQAERRQARLRREGEGGDGE